MKAKIKIIFSVTLLAVVLFAAIPKVYIHSLLGHVHSTLHSSDDLTVSENDDTQDCNFKKFDTPVYYTVFKFILNFLPKPSSKSTSFYYLPSQVSKPNFNISLLRGPPVV